MFYVFQCNSVFSAVVLLFIALLQLDHNNPALVDLNPVVNAHVLNTILYHSVLFVECHLTINVNCCTLVSIVEKIERGSILSLLRHKISFSSVMSLFLLFAHITGKENLQLSLFVGVEIDKGCDAPFLNSIIRSTYFIFIRFI